jgi:hypothetical protein
MARRRKEVDVGPRAVVVKDAARIVTVEAHDSIWTDGDVVARDEWRGAYVKLRPAEGAPDARIEQVQKHAQGVARAVRTMARRTAIVTAPQRAVARTSIRSIVERMIEEATTNDRPALATLVHAVLGEVGL